jgi:hypothetical protein
LLEHQEQHGLHEAIQVSHRAGTRILVVKALSR